MVGGAEGALGRIDKYELKRELGEGGFGTVYLAHDTVADVDVAVKGLPPEVKHNAVELESIRGNFALVKRLRHPNIVAVTDLHQALSVKYASKEVESKLRIFERDTMVVMDYAPGVTLAQWRRQFPDGKVPLEKAVAVVRQVASALDYAHGQKVLHRDVKPANVMVETSDGGKIVARVLDFGLAAEIRSSMGRLSREIRDTSGTRPYMAPEQWKGDRQGPATDQYALAAMFCELVAGEVPFASVFDCGDPAVMRLAVTTDAPKMPSPLPKNMRKALAVALAKKPEERFATCGDFVAALEGRKVKVSRRGGRAALVAVVLLAALVVVGWWFAGRQPTPVDSVQSVAHSPPVASGSTNNVPPDLNIISNDVVSIPPPAVSNNVDIGVPQTSVVSNDIAIGEIPASPPVSNHVHRAVSGDTDLLDAGRRSEEEKTAPLVDEGVKHGEEEKQTGKRGPARQKVEAVRKTVEAPAISNSTSVIVEQPKSMASVGVTNAPAMPPVVAKPAQPAIAEPAPPKLTVRAELNGREVKGARMQKMTDWVVLPHDWPERLPKGRSYGPYLVQYDDGNGNYYGSFKIDDVNWNGHTNITVRLGENWPEDVRRPALGIQSWAL